MLELTGVTHTYRFKLAAVLPVRGARGLRRTVKAETAIVKVNDKGRAFSVVVTGHNTQDGTPKAHAIFYQQDLTDDHPTALSLAIAAEREFTGQRTPDPLPGWPDPDARPTY